MDKMYVGMDVTIVVGSDRYAAEVVKCTPMKCHVLQRVAQGYAGIPYRFTLRSNGEWVVTGANVYGRRNEIAPRLETPAEHTPAPEGYCEVHNAIGDASQREGLRGIVCGSCADAEEKARAEGSAA